MKDKQAALAYEIAVAIHRVCEGKPLDLVCRATVDAATAVVGTSVALDRYADAMMAVSQHFERVALRGRERGRAPEAHISALPMPARRPRAGGIA